jgi:hypothetical protein
MRQRLLSLHRGPLKRRTIVMIPGMADLLKEIKALEDFIRACQSREEERMVLLTREEADVIESFRRFKAQDYD